MKLSSVIIENGDIIHINRGDRLVFEHSIEMEDGYYTFKEGDYITFGIYKKLNEEPLVYEKFIPEVGSTSMDIDISAEKMKIGEPVNVKKEYYYEISLNDEVTTKGFDQDEEKILWLYPEGMTPDVES